MKEYIVERVFEVADYVIENRCTVREAAKAFCISKSTAHKDLNERLPLLSRSLFQKASVVLQENWQERYLRGGEATKRKFEKLSDTQK